MKDIELFKELKANAEHMQRSHPKEHSLRVIYGAVLSALVILGAQILIPEYLGPRVKIASILAIPILLLAALLEYNKLRAHRDE